MTHRDREEGRGGKGVCAGGNSCIPVASSGCVLPGFLFIFPKLNSIGILLLNVR